MTSGGGPLDIFGRIQSILSSFSSFVSKDTTLKRRAPDHSDHPSMTKYRRVSNVFPQIITRNLDDDSSFIFPRIVNSTANMTGRTLPQHPNISQIPSRRTLENNYADLEYSDDDDFIFKNPRNRTVANSAQNNQGVNCCNNKSVSKIIFPDRNHIPVIVPNARGSTSLNSGNVIRKPKTVTLNGNLSDIAPSVPVFNNNRNPSSVTKSDRKTWHKLLSKTYRETNKTIPGLIDAKTGKLAASSIPNDYAGNFGSTQTYMNGIDYQKEPRITNGIVADSYAKVVSMSERHPTSASQKKITNMSTEKTFNIRERNTYEELLRKIVPGLYKSKDVERNRKQLAQLAQARGVDTKNQKVIATISLADDDDDDEPREFIDLSKDDEKMVSACEKIQGSPNALRRNELPVVEPINTLRDKLDTAPRLKPEWLENFSTSYKEKSEQNKRAIIEATEDVRKAAKDTATQETALIDNFRNCMVFHGPIILDESDEEEEEEFPEFTEEQRSMIKRSIYRGSQDEVLISKFNMNITRRDILTLLGDTWLNDEVINFYMNLLMERSELRSSEGLPRVYAMNTFFVPRLLQSGHSGVRRWTRKVDIFSYDVIPIPVHVGQVHWCMAIIHLKKKTIKYYDSMGTPNPRLLNALEDYLREESLDKRKEHFDTSKFIKESVAEAPRQMNGSDCGVFSCMFAEYITRNRDITFSQQHMPYFRHKMILEIVQGKLLL